MRRKMKCEAVIIIQQDGFSLIELMVTVVILGIIAAIAYPNYTEYVTAARRADGMSGILRLAADLEKFKGNCGQYTANITGGSPFQPACSGLGIPTGNVSPDLHYSMVIALIPDAATGAATGYTITSTPQASQAVRDTSCGTFTYRHDGVKTVSGSKPLKYCWKQ
jgi:type IV pilus assembly protein PilE